MLCWGPPSSSQRNTRSSLQHIFLFSSTTSFHSHFLLFFIFLLRLFLHRCLLYFNIIFAVERTSLPFRCLASCSFLPHFCCFTLNSLHFHEACILFVHNFAPLHIKYMYSSHSLASVCYKLFFFAFITRYYHHFYHCFLLLSQLHIFIVRMALLLNVFKHSVSSWITYFCFVSWNHYR